ncbi:hypothetical protein [Methyloceanibacter sp.]|uniref:hypothetical protein n=1 Tax=Methyloceanibacter sp. TaxID=1965321 RepID=UPI00351AB876
MVKRSSVPRIRSDISEEVATAFRQALKLRDHREAQLADSKHCPGVGRCEVCDQYERLVAVVDGAIDLKPHELSPLDVIDGPAPPMWKDHEQADWDRARDQHVELAKEAKIKPRTKALLTDACRGRPMSGGLSDRAKSLTVHLSASRSACRSSSERLFVRFTLTPITGQRSSSW